MAITVGELSVLLSAKNQMSQVLKDVQGDMSNTEKSGLSLGKVLGGAFAVGAAAAVGATIAVGKALWDAGQAAAQEEIGIAKLGAAVKATGADWGTASAAIEAYLAAELKRTALDDGAGREAISRLVTITGDYSKALDLMSLAQDLAAAKGMDLSSAAEVVGKVSAGNTGILSRYGIVLKEGATAQEALAAMQQQFAGQAEAYGNTYAGAQQKMQVAMGNLKETVGGLVLPVMASFATKMSELAIQVLPIVEDAVQDLRPVFDSISQVVTSLVVNVWPKLIGAFESVAGSADGLGRTVGGLGPILTTAADLLRDVLGGALAAVQPVLQGLVDLWAYAWPWIQAIVTKVLNDVVPFIKNMMYDAAEFVQTTIGGLLKWWDANFPLIWSTVSKILGFISDLWDTVWPALSTALEAVWKIMQTTVETFIGNILSIIRAVMLIINGDWAGAWEEVKKILERTWNALKEIVGTALRALLDIVGPAVAELAAKFTNIDWGALGRGIIDGIRGGIENAAGALGDAAANAARRALDAAKRFLGIGSPSKVAAEEIGRPFVEGIQTGMDAAAPDLMDTVADIMDSMVGVAESLTALGGYQSATGIGGVVDALIADTREAGKRLVAFFKLWKDSTFENVAMGGEASGLLGAMFAPIRQWVDGIVEIAGYQKAADIGRATEELIADTRIAGKQLVAFFKLWKDTTFENVEMGGAAAKALAALFAPAKQIVDGVMAIASYQKQYNIGQAIADLIADARIAGKQLVTYFKLWHDGTFENVAMATAAGTAMAGLFKPVSTIIDGVVAIAEYQKAKRLTKAVQGMISDARTAGKALVDYFKLWHDGTFGNVAMATGAAQAMAGLFGAIQGMAESLMSIVGLPAIQPEQLDAAILLLTGFANGFMGACAYLLQAVDEVARLIMPGITAAMSSFAVSAAAAYDYLVIGMDTLGRMASKALAGESQVNTLVASLQRTLNQLRLAASIQAQINGVSAKTTIGGGNIALPTNGGGNSSTTNNSYNLTVQTVQPAVNVVGSFRMLEAIG